MTEGSALQFPTALSRTVFNHAGKNYVQHYSKMHRANIALQKHLPDARVSLARQQGAFDKALVPCPLPPELRGRSVLLDVMAKRKYPRIRGKLPRRRADLEAGSAATLSRYSACLSISNGTRSSLSLRSLIVSGSMREAFDRACHSAMPSYVQ